MRRPYPARMRRPFVSLLLLGALLLLLSASAACGGTEAAGPRHLVRIGTFASPLYLTAPRSEPRIPRRRPQP